MSQTFIPGRLGVVTINANDVSAVGNVTSMSKSRDLLTKKVFGSDWAFTNEGQKIASFSASGFVAAEKAAALQAAFAAGTVTCSIQTGAAGQATDGGTESGEFVVGEYSVSANADGDWEWSLSAQSDGVITYTPAAGASS